MKQPAVAAIVPAAGSGTRLQSHLSRPKQLARINGKPVLSHTLLALERTGLIEFAIIPTREDLVDNIWQEVIHPYDIQFVSEVIPGGDTRQKSVFAALQRLQPDTADQVLVHDGVRPFVTASIIERTIQTARDTGAAIAGIPAVDTVKQARNGIVERTIDRTTLWYAQTPQVFHLPLLISAFRYAQESGFTGTDEAMLVEHLGEKVTMVEGSKQNLKITDPQDLVLAKALFAIRRDVRE